MSIPSSASCATLVRLCEGPKPDSFMLDLLNVLLQRPDRDQGYHYAIARFYELVGNLIGQSPGFRNMAPLFWNDSILHLEKAQRECSNEVNALLRAKESILRYWMSTVQHGEGERALLQRALGCYRRCTEGRQDELRLVARGLAVFADTLLLYHDLKGYVVSQLKVTEPGGSIESDLIPSLTKKVEEWNLKVDQLVATVPDLNSKDAKFIRSLKSLRAAQLHKLVYDRNFQVAGGLVKQGRSPLVAETLHLAFHEKLKEFSRALAELGCQIPVKSTEGGLSQSEADYLLSQARDRFREALAGDALRAEQAAGLSARLLFELPQPACTFLKDGPLCDELRKMIREAGLEVTESAGLCEGKGQYWLMDNGRRYRLVPTSENGQVNRVDVFDPTHERVLFDGGEGVKVAEFASLIGSICKAYREAINLTHEGGQLTSELCSSLLNVMRRAEEGGAKEGRTGDLTLKLKSLAKHAISESRAHADYLEKKAVYAWSLLEMFEVRGQSVRLNTLFSGECQLLMEDPWDEGRLLEIGADPVFRSAVRLILEGPKRQMDVLQFTKMLLRSVIVTAREQIRCLREEAQYIDASLELREIKKMILRLRCHEALAEGLLQLSDLAMLGAKSLRGEECSATERGLELFSNARTSQLQLETFRSSLVDDQALEYLEHYFHGLYLNARGSLVRKARGKWEELYKLSERELLRAKDRLSAVEYSYLLGSREDRERLGKRLEALIREMRGKRRRYRFEDCKESVEAGKAAEEFHGAEGIYRELGDFRNETRMSASNWECRALDDWERGEGYRDAATKKLWIARAFYASCGDRCGMERIEAFYSVHCSPDESFDLAAESVFQRLEAQDQLRGGPFADILAPLGARLRTEIEEAMRGSARPDEPRVAHEVLDFLLDVLGHELKSPRFISVQSEKACQVLLQDLLTMRGRLQFDEKKSGNGLPDLVVRGLPVEVKVWERRRSRKRREADWIQTARYALSLGACIGFLVVFDFSEEWQPDGAYTEYLRTERICGKHVEGDGANGVLLIEVRIPYFRKPPSKGLADPESG